MQLVWFPIKHHLDVLGLGTENAFSTSKIFYKSNSTVKTTQNREGKITKGKKKQFSFQHPVKYCLLGNNAIIRICWGKRII